jgi:hypothetical protein
MGCSNRVRSRGPIVRPLATVLPFPIMNGRPELGRRLLPSNDRLWVWPKAVGQGVFAHLRSFRLDRYVSEMALHPDVTRLAETLEAMTTLLKLHGDNGWAEQVERCRSSIAQSDYHGVDRLLCLYGGMGSLNDVILQSGGVAPAEDNERFDALRTDAWKQANTLARDVVRGNGR